MAETQNSKPAAPADAGASWGLQSAFHASALGAIVVAVIYFGQPILMPAALAILLAFALEPLVARLRSLGLGRIPSVVVTVLVALVVIGGLGSYIVSEFASLVGALPRYESNIAHKINSLRSAAEGDSMVGRVTAALDRLERDLSMTGMGTRSLPGTMAAQHVVVDSQSRSPIGILRDVVGPLLDPLATVVIVIIFVVFILLQREDLRDRFIRLAGSRDLRRTAVALDDGASRLSRYLLMQTGINAAFGIMVGAGLWIIGIPNPGLWGLIGMMFRFVPYVGVPVAAAIPVGLAFAIDPGWSKVGWTVALYAAIEPVLGQFVEPFVYGRSIGLSATAVVAAATFWTWVWGPSGLLLSTPLTMCLVVIGRHVDQLRFLDVLLGDRPPLELEEGLYLRMLGGDPDEAAYQAEGYLERNSISAYYDDVAVKALFMAQADARHGALDRDRRHAIRMTLEGLIQNLAHRGDDTRPAGPKDEPHHAAAASIPHEWSRDAVLCVAGPGPLDEMAAMLLADLLSKHEIGARVVPHAEVLPINIERFDATGVRFVAVCYLEPANFTNARYLVRRLKRHFPDSRLLLNFLGVGPDDSRYHDAVDATGSDLIATSLREALERVLYYAKHASLDSALNHDGTLVA